ncbi:Fibulin-2 [Platysternon megacephalum]|uniref:Fibulin-2 n=1 Tax=Platysternon megacephalum TaxID=55544 RepID=A0A4D9E7W8_9SAUR|nr:Fibulin-2 [Platysternon megacephalum]
MLVSDVPVRCIDSSPQENAGVFCRLPSSQHFLKSPFAVDFTSAMAATLLIEKPGEQPVPPLQGQSSTFEIVSCPLSVVCACYLLNSICAMFPISVLYFCTEKNWSTLGRFILNSSSVCPKVNAHESKSCCISLSEL